MHQCMGTLVSSMSACLISQSAISGPAALFLFDAVVHGIALHATESMSRSVFLAILEQHSMSMEWAVEEKQ